MQPLTPCGGEAVDACSLITLRYIPSGSHETLKFQPLEGWVQRPGFHLNSGFRALAYSLSDAVAVQMSEGQGAEDEHVQRTLQELDALTLHDGQYIGSLYTLSIDMLRSICWQSL
jgi:hypothetical protein